MGLILRPAEVKNGVAQVRANIESTRESYSGALSVVQAFSQNEALKSDSWDTAKSNIFEAHQVIVQGMCAAQVMMENDLNTLETSVEGSNDLDEDILFAQIQKLTLEYIMYEEMISRLIVVQNNMVLGTKEITVQLIAHYRTLLCKTRTQLDMLNLMLQALHSKETSTAFLFQEVEPLIQAVQCAINDATVYIKGEGTLSDGNWKTTIPETINEIVNKNLEAVLETKLEIDIQTFEEVYGKEKVEELRQFVKENKIYGVSEQDTKKIMVKTMEEASGCTVIVVIDEETKEERYQFRAGHSIIIREFPMDKIKENLQAGGDSWKNKELVIPETVVDSTGKEYHPFTEWGGLGMGGYNEGVQKDSDGRYWIAVAPKLMEPYYPDSGKLLGTDFEYCKVDLVLENEVTGEEKIVKCAIGDVKAHTYNEYNLDTGETVLFNIESGLGQTGIRYPKAVNPIEYAPDTTNVSLIEFMGHEMEEGFETSDYTLKSIIVIEEENTEEYVYD